MSIEYTIIKSIKPNLKGEIELEWVNPSFLNFVEIKIQRRLLDYGIEDNQGDTIYRGKIINNFTDSGKKLDILESNVSAVPVYIPPTLETVFSSVINPLGVNKYAGATCFIRNEIYPVLSNDIIDIYLSPTPDLATTGISNGDGFLLVREINGILLENEIYYYSIFCGKDTNGDGIADEWILGNLSKSTSVSIDVTEVSDVLFNKLPRVYKNRDVDNQLKKFLKILNSLLNYCYTHLNIYEKNRNIFECDEKIIPYFANILRVFDVPELPANTRRFTIFQIMNYYKIKGTENSIVGMIEAYSNWESEIL